MKLNKLLAGLALISGVLALGSAQANVKLTIAATPVPHAEILDHIKPILAKEGVDLEVKVFTDYIQPNLQVAQGNIEANFFQHKPYLDTFNKNNHTDLVSIGLVHVEPFGAYSTKVKKLDELKEGAIVALPNDPSNEARALLLLQAHHLIQLKDPKNLLSTPRDIVDNPKKLQFKPLDAAMLPRILPDVDLALINTNYALQAKLNPVKDALIIEDKNSPYANLVATTPKNANKPELKKLMEALHSEDVKKFIETKYKGAIVPAF